MRMESIDRKSSFNKNTIKKSVYFNVNNKNNKVQKQPRIKIE